MEEERQPSEKKEQQQSELREAFMSREIHPEVIDRINKAVRIAAEQGHNQLQVITFPCSFCNDGGRRINIADPDWPSTLEGFAKRAYDFYREGAASSRVQAARRVISFPVACRARSAFS